MSGVISFRTDRSERALIKQQAVAAGFTNLSDYARHRFGLPPGLGKTAPLPEMEDADDIQGLAKSVHSLVDRVNDMRLDIGRIARFLEVPREVEPKEPSGPWLDIAGGMPPATVHEIERPKENLPGGFER